MHETVKDYLVIKAIILTTTEQGLNFGYALGFPTGSKAALLNLHSPSKVTVNTISRDGETRLKS